MSSQVPEGIGPDTPLRLDLAARVAFPGGGMTASGLRREAARGHLTIERIAGKLFTTLGAVAAMREKCRVQPHHPDCGSENAAMGQTSGSSLMPDGRSAQAHLHMIAERLKRRSNDTSGANTSLTSATVIPLGSR